MIINVIENDINTQLLYYLGTIDILGELVNLYNKGDIGYIEFIQIAKFYSKKYKIEYLYEKIINILKTFPRVDVIYEKNNINYICKHYKYIINKHKHKQKKILQIYIKIFKPRNIHDIYFLQYALSFYMFLH